MNPSETTLTILPAQLWQRDRTLKRASELLERRDNKVRAVSFDFFDTLVWRLVNRPTDLFYEVGRRLAEANLLTRRCRAEDFAALRRMAELNARERQALKDRLREDVTLPQIYAGLETICTDTSAAAAVECEVEADFCFANPVMFEFVQYARSRGLKVLVLSDMYLSSDQLRAILRANGCDPEWFELILTSSETGVCKGTGNLYQLAMRKLGLNASHLLHIGDSLNADVGGARKAGVRGCHYTQETPESSAILEREHLLQPTAPGQFSVNHLRLLAARHFAEENEVGWFGREGAMLLGPLLTRFATWACQQFVAAGVRQVGAFMREGELLGQMLQREAEATAAPLRIQPLFINRKSTDLAAIGKLTADNLIDWLGRRTTLTVKTILADFGLAPAEVAHLPLALEAKLEGTAAIMQLAKCLFTPEIARRIEVRSQEERQKVMDYLQPWLDSGPLGVCDIGYNGSAQMQLQRILDLEGVTTPVVGCYLITTEIAARRVLEGLDIRTFLGAFGAPESAISAFIRSPAFIEQSMVAPMGTTLGYQRQADGKVTPLLDRLPFGENLLQWQSSFKAGILHYQALWLSFRRAKPALLDGDNALSRRVLADIDHGSQPILARAAAFPLRSELSGFGAIPLDDHYYEGGVRTICGERDRMLVQTRGYGRALREPTLLWPQGAYQMHHARASMEFFSYAKAMLYNRTERDLDAPRPELSVILRVGTDRERLRACLRNLAVRSRRDLQCEVVLVSPGETQWLEPVAGEFSAEAWRVTILATEPHQTLTHLLNRAADHAMAPLLLFLEDSMLLPANWDMPLLRVLPHTPRAGAQLVTYADRQKRRTAFSPAHCVLLTRTAFLESGGLKDKLSMPAAFWDLLMELRAIDWEWSAVEEPLPSLPTGDEPPVLSDGDRDFLARQWVNFKSTLASFLAPINSVPEQEITVAWEGTFLDYGSLSHVNRELTRQLARQPGLRLSRIGSRVLANGYASRPELQALAREILPQASGGTQVTVRHAWPPNWSPVRHGALVIIQPWEYGSLPAEWVAQARQVHQFWVPSEHVRQVYVRSGIPESKVKVVPNGIDAEHFRPEATPLVLPTRKAFKFLFVGGTIHRKGPDILLEAYLNSFTAQDDVCLVIKDFGGQSCYAGQTMEAVIQAAQSRPNAPEIVYLNDELPPESLPGLYTACDCLVHPYRGEGFGLPVLEAMACGLAVIVTEGGAADDFAAPNLVFRVPSKIRPIGGKVGTISLAGEGWLLEPSVSDTASQMRYVFEHRSEARSRGQAASERVRQGWTWERSARVIRQNIEELKPHLATSESGSAPPKQVGKLTLPACALLGHLAGAREAVKQNQWRQAWEATVAALAVRPCHPEAYLLLSQIAAQVGDGETASRCANKAQSLAPGWKEARRVARQKFHHRGRPDWLKIPPALSAEKLRLTVCLITRNEEKFLGACLGSVRGLADELVVVDTGSTDRTVQIAEEHGARVSHFEWCDDFSAARNAALAQATGDWVLMLDADETLPESSHAALLKLLVNPQVMAWRLPIVDHGREDQGCSYVPRLFRNAPALFYVGRVHEQVFGSIEVRRQEWGLENRLADATLLHFGYTAAVIKDRNKIQRNLLLLERALLEMPGEPNLLMNYGLELARSERLPEALVQYRLAYQRMSALPDEQLVPETREMLLAQMCTQFLAANRLEEVVEILTSPLARRGGLNASLHFSLGLAYLRLQQFKEAEQEMLQCLATRQQPSLSPVNAEIRKGGPRHCLALCRAALGRKDAALEDCRQAVAEDPGARPIRFDYARLLADAGQLAEALQILHALSTEDPTEARVWEFGGLIALSHPELLEVAVDWTTEATLHLPGNTTVWHQQAQALLLSAQPERALAVWRKLGDDLSMSHLGARTLCELATGAAVGPIPTDREAGVSQEFIRWYQRLLQYGANDLVLCLHQAVTPLEAALPTAARILTAAMAEAEAVGA